MTEHTRNAGTIDRLYALDAGIAVAPDRSVYSPGKRHGEPVALSCNAYLIRRAGRWLMWDTGIDDAVAEQPGGRVIAHGITGIVTRTIRAQLADVGIAAADVGTVLLSHAHFDHIGNAALFPHATWYMARHEHDAMFGPRYQEYGYAPSLYRCLRATQVQLTDGDLDLFGDGSVRIISTPGHTPGHCSLLVRLAGTGPVLLSGDVAHYRANMVHRCVPAMNSDPEASRQSMARVAAIVRDHGARLWLNHDREQSAAIAHAPSYFE